MPSGAPSLRLPAILLTLALIPGCQTGDASPDVDAGVRVETSTPPMDATGVPTDLVIRLKTNRHLDGHSVLRERFSLRSGPVGSFLLGHYEPVTRELRLWPSVPLRRYGTYLLEVDEGITGLDGGKLQPGLLLRFTTGDERTGEQPRPPRDFPSEIEPLLQRKCASCHGGPRPIAGLALDTPSTVGTTAIDAPATGWPGWRRIRPSRPDESYLLLKLLDVEDLAGLRMPRLLDGPGPPLTAAELTAISEWIAAGAFLYPEESAD